MPHLGCSSQGAKTKRKAYIGLGYEGMLPVTIFPLELLDLIHCIDPGGRDHAGQSLWAPAQQDLLQLTLGKLGVVCGNLLETDSFM